MLRALLLDLGETLVHEGEVLPRAPEALDAMSRLPTQSGQPLQLALVSDYMVADPDGGDAEVSRLFTEYVTKVRDFGLLRFFEPAERHVTLSTQARVKKPHRQVFELALRRLRLDPDLSTAMFVTEDLTHVVAARKLGMTAWQYGADFDDWSAAPLLVARALGIDDAGKLLEAVNIRLTALYGVRLERLETTGSASWTGTTDSAERIAISIDPHGDVASLSRLGPLDDRERRFRDMLVDNAAIVPSGAPLPPGATHVDAPAADGTSRPHRKRFKLF